jgi:hypothetical protein
VLCWTKLTDRDRQCLMRDKAVGSFDTLAPAAPDERPAASAFQANLFLSYISTLSVDSKGGKYELVK